MINLKNVMGGLGLACAIGALAIGSAQTAAAEVSFAGKTVEIMVNFEAGGGTDTAARLVAPFVAKHLPGNPGVIVTNKGGAGGTAAVDYLIDSVAPDGLHIGYFAGTPLRWALGLQQVPEGTGDLPYVAGRSVNQIFMTRTDLNLNFDTLPGNGDPLFIAINSPDNHVAIRARLLADAVGADKFKVITGYTTQGKMVAAVRANEAEIAQTNDSFFGANREGLMGDGKLVPLGQMGEYRNGEIVSQAGLEDVPVFDALWRAAAPDTIDTPEYKAWQAIHIAMSVQNVFVLPPNTPEEYREAWSDAVLAAYNDPEYVAQIKESAGGLVPSSAGYKEVAASMQRLKDLFSDPAVKNAIKAAIDKNME